MPNSNFKIVLHIDETLSSADRIQLESKLTQAKGIVEAHIDSRKHHLMLVDYDHDELSRVNVLQKVQSQGVHAELCG